MGSINNQGLSVVYPLLFVKLGYKSSIFSRL